ncbi:glycine--tRNA ligase subunit beta [Nocardia sp. NPDC057440]|uniref:glycine--tRNA ligase subunit beta n=1 Tax=Nocardia sp. NPDC057440 TaxID=3346134 RepID=UPI00366C3552
MVFPARSIRRIAAGGSIHPRGSRPKRGTRKFSIERIASSSPNRRGSQAAGIYFGADEYACKAGELAPVAEALPETELPRHHSDRLPATLPGALLALADRFDLLVAMLAVGTKLTGTSDPFGLRRPGHSPNPARTPCTRNAHLSPGARHCG